MNKIRIYGPIGRLFDGVTAEDIDDQLDGMSGPLTVLVNSPGGIGEDGLAIYNRLQEYDGEITVKVMSVAASAATLPVMAGDIIEMSRGSRLMIHKPWGTATGNDDELSRYVNGLKALSGEVAEIYANRSGASIEDMSAAMAAETWYNADAAIGAGLATAKAKEASEAAPEMSAKLFAIMGVCNVPDDFDKPSQESVEVWRRNLQARQLQLKTA